MRSEPQSPGANPSGRAEALNHDAIAELGQWLITAAAQRVSAPTQLLDSFEVRLQEIVCRGRSLPKLRSAREVVGDLLAHRSAEKLAGPSAERQRNAEAGATSNVAAATGLFCVPGLTVTTGLAASDRALWMARQAANLAFDARLPVTLLGPRGNDAEITRALVEVIAARRARTRSPKSKPAGGRSELRALFKDVLLEVGELEDQPLHDIRAIVRRPSRRFGGHHVMMIDLATNWRILPVDVILPTLDALPQEGAHIIGVAEHLR